MGYWLADWLDGQDVNSVDEAGRCLDSKKAFHTLMEAVEAAASDERALRQGDGGGGHGQGVVAGRQLDLSGIYTCWQAPCLIRQLDEGLAPIWQYFDEIVVEGLPPRHLLANASWEGDLGAEEMLLSHVAVYFCAKEIGALPYLEFRHKPFLFCANHYREHAEDVGLPATLDDDAARRVVRRLKQDGNLDFTEIAEGKVMAYFSHPFLESGLYQILPARDIKKHRPSKGTFAELAFRHMCLAMVSDVALARDMRYPLASDVSRVLPFGGNTSSPVVTPESVALSLHLPILKGATSVDILRLREEHRTEFDRFRGALSAAIREQVNRAAAGDDPAGIAAAVVREYVAPELADINQQLTTARSALNVKAAQRIVVGGLVTTIGLLTAMPLLVGTGVTTVLSAGLSLEKFIDERHDVLLSDMYFLVQAERDRARHEGVT